MFCTHCGQQLIEGANFCSNCGSPQGSVSPMRSAFSGAINLNESRSLVPAMCPNCNAHMRVDTSNRIARCNNCGTECLVQDAIKSINVTGIVQVSNATINVSNTNINSLLQRVEMMLQEEDFDEAKERCNTILDSDPTNAQVFLFLLMAYYGCRKRKELAYLASPFDKHQYYVKAIKYGTPDLKRELQGYIDVINRRNVARQSNLRVGDEFYFGTDSRGERIWWKTLDIRSGMALVISTESLATLPYHQTTERTTWFTCTLRYWLNNELYNDCFSPEERARIIPYDHSVGRVYSPNSLTNIQNTDKLFLLSLNEASQLFANDKSRELMDVSWWLRSTDYFSYDAPVVGVDGMINSNGICVALELGVRPALWIKTISK